MAEDYYPDEAAMPPAPEAAPTDETKPPEKSGNSALIPKELVKGDVQPGQLIQLRVEHVWEDEIEVCPPDTEYSEGKESTPEEDEIAGLAMEE